MSNLKSKFGKKLKLIRAEKGLTQEELARKTGLHQTYPSKMENGHRGPTLEVIARLANILNVKPKELFDFEELKEN